jgi:hypothetical protein
MHHAIAGHQIGADDACRSTGRRLACACRLNTRTIRCSAYHANLNTAQHPDASATRLNIRQAQPTTSDEAEQSIVFTAADTLRRARPGKVGWREYGVDAWAVKQFRSKAGTAERGAETLEIWISAKNIHDRRGSTRRDLRAAIEQ